MRRLNSSAEYPSVDVGGGPQECFNPGVKQLPRSYWQCGMCGGGRECTAGGPPCVFVGKQTPAS